MRVGEKITVDPPPPIIRPKTLDSGSMIIAQDLRNESQVPASETLLAAASLIQKEAVMRTLHKLTAEIDSARVAVLFGLSIGLGLAVHEGFFLVAGAIAVGAVTVAAVHAVHEHAERSRLAHQIRGDKSRRCLE